MRARRDFALVVVLFRALAFLVALQCSGAMHFVIDAVELSEGHPHVTDDCGGGDDDCPAGCPPGCPTCHCGTGFLVSLPPVAESGSAAIARPLREVGLFPREDREPTSAERTSVFRPPRPLFLEA
jgi:hypothetical protein